MIPPPPPRCCPRPCPFHPAAAHARAHGVPAEPLAGGPPGQGGGGALPPPHRAHLGARGGLGWGGGGRAPWCSGGERQGGQDDRSPAAAVQLLQHARASPAGRALLHRRPAHRRRPCLQVPVSERHAVVVQSPVHYSIRSMLLGRVGFPLCVCRGADETGGRSAAARGARPAPAVHWARCPGRSAACLVGHLTTPIRRSAPTHPAAHTQAGEYLAFDWRPEEGSVLHVVPLLGGEVSGAGARGSGTACSLQAHRVRSSCTPPCAPCLLTPAPPMARPTPRTGAGAQLPRARLPGGPLCQRV